MGVRLVRTKAGADSARTAARVEVGTEASRPDTKRPRTRRAGSRRTGSKNRVSSDAPPRIERFDGGVLHALPELSKVIEIGDRHRSEVSGLDGLPRQEIPFEIALVLTALWKCRSDVPLKRGTAGRHAMLMTGLMDGTDPDRTCVT